MRLLPGTPGRWILAGVLLLICFVFLLLPPAPAELDPRGWPDLASRTVAGAYHVHSTRSDGGSDKTAIAAAAATAGLRFVILTDHGDGTRPPDPPEYINGVLCIDAVEISSDDGHYVALDMRRAPYPLGGAASAVVEDVERLGGFGIAAHPDSPRPSLRWTDTEAPIDGIEWLNGDSEWRDETRAALWKAAAGYPFRPAAALARLLDRPSTLDRWDRITRTRPVVGLAALDAHGGIGRGVEDNKRSEFVPIPSYESMFRTFSIRVILDRPWRGDAALDAHALLTAIRSGSVYSTIDALATNGLLDFHADTAGQSAPMGAVLTPGTNATLVARALQPAGATIVLLHDGREVSSGRGEIRYRVDHAQGAYRAEVRVSGAPGTPPVPWLVGNPVYFLAPRSAPPPIVEAGREATPLDADRWRIEKDAGSSAILRTRSGEVELEYALRSAPRESQYVALAHDVSDDSFKRVQLSLSSDRPMRVSVQFRRKDGERWGRSVYVAPDDRGVSLPVSEFRPIGEASGRIEPPAIQSLLLVVDLTNASPGRSGMLRVKSSALVK